MSFGQFINPDTGTFTDGHLVAKAFEALRLEFRDRMDDFEAFAAANQKRAYLVLKVEGRNTDTVVRALRPFAEGWCSTPARIVRQRKVAADRYRAEYPHMARMIEKGQA